MPGPGEIMGRWVAIKIRDLLTEWKEKRKVPKNNTVNSEKGAKENLGLNGRFYNRIRKTEKKFN